MSKDPAFLLYYKDFDSDTADWEADAVGWYMRLLIFQAGSGYIPNDIEEIAQVARVKFSEYQSFSKRWAVRLACKFIPLSDGKLYNKKLAKVQSERKSGAIKKSVLAVFGNFLKSAKLGVMEEKSLKEVFHKEKSFYEILDAEKRKEEILIFLNNSIFCINNNKQPLTKRIAKRTQQEDEVEDENVNKEVIEKEKKVVEKKSFSDEVESCYKNCLAFFPEQLHPEKPENWKDTIEKLNRIEKIPFQIIEKITKSAREDDFWSKQFLSLPKLRAKQASSGLKYIVVFNEKFKSKPKTINRQTEEVIRENMSGLDPSMVDRIRKANNQIA